MIAQLDLFFFLVDHLKTTHEVRPSSDEWSNGAQASERRTRRNMEEFTAFAHEMVAVTTKTDSP